MNLDRIQRHRDAENARRIARRGKPVSRRQAQAWLAPIRSAFAEMRTGYTDSVRGFAVTRIHHEDAYVRVDFALNGFLALLERLMPDLDATPMRTVSKKLAAGVPLTTGELEDCQRLLKVCEDRLIKFTRDELVSAANTEMLLIEVESLGLQEEAL